MNCHDTRERLDAYLDRELGVDESALVRVHVERCGDCGRALADREDLGRLVRRAPYYTASESLRSRLATVTSSSQPAAGTPASRQAPVWLAWAASVAIAAVLSGSVTWRLAQRRADAIAESGVAAELLNAHVRALMGEHLFDVRSTDQHTVKPWFLGKLDFSPPVTDLAASGFPLVGGRLDYVAGHAAAALVYQRRQHTINLFIWPEASAAKADARAIRGFQVRQWHRDGMAFWAVSDLNDAELSQFEALLTP